MESAPAIGVEACLPTIRVGSREELRTLLLALARDPEGWKTPILLQLGPGVL